MSVWKGFFLLVCALISFCMADLCRAPNCRSSLKDFAQWGPDASSALVLSGGQRSRGGGALCSALHRGHVKINASVTWWRWRQFILHRNVTFRFHTARRGIEQTSRGHLACIVVSFYINDLFVVVFFFLTNVVILKMCSEKTFAGCNSDHRFI